MSDKNIIRIAELSRCRGMLDVMEHTFTEERAKSLIDMAKIQRIDGINDIYEIKLTNKEKKLLNRESLQYESIGKRKNINYYLTINDIYKNDIKYSKFFIEEDNNKAVCNYDDVMILLKKICDIKYDNNIVEKKSKKIYEICENINELIRDDKINVIYGLAEFSKRIYKEIVDKDFVNICIKKMMFDIGYKIEKYYYNGIYVIMNSTNMTNIDEIEKNILTFYISGYKKFFNNINDVENKKRENINKSLYDIKDYFAENKGAYITNSEIRSKLYYSDITVKRALLALQNDKIIKRVGAKKNSKYKYIGE